MKAEMGLDLEQHFEREIGRRTDRDNYQLADQMAKADI